MAKKKSVKKKRAEDQAGKPGFEESLAELQSIVTSLEDGRQPLEKSLEDFERGMHLLRHCHTVLTDVSARIEILTGVGEDGAELEPFDGAATYRPASDDQESPPAGTNSPDGLF